MVPLPEVWPYLLVHCLASLLIAAALGLWLSRRPTPARAACLLFLSTAAGLVLGLLTKPVHPAGPGFATLLAWTWTLGLVLPIASLVVGAALARKRVRDGAPFIALGLAVALVSIDAFVIEPRSFVVRRVQLASTTIERPLRIGLIADLQTDRPGDYERRALAAVVAEHPDLVLFAGDLIQEFDDDLHTRHWVVLREILNETGFAPPLGTWAVSGDSEWRPEWIHELRGTPVRLLSPPVQTLELRDDLDLTGLPLDVSRAPLELPRPSAARYHIVVGHRPDYALGNVDADLLLAGHTHGGQVQLPWFGPILTLSEVPRRWAAGGVHTIDADSTLVVSRGLGMERGIAPRLRFWCRPEVVIIDIVPAAAKRG